MAELYVLYQECAFVSECNKHVVLLSLHTKKQGFSALFSLQQLVCVLCAPPSKHSWPAWKGSVGDQDDDLPLSSSSLQRNNSKTTSWLCAAVGISAKEKATAP